METLSYLKRVNDCEYDYKFDSFPGGVLTIHYDFYYDRFEPWDSDGYEIDIKAIYLKGTKVDLSNIISDSEFKRIIDDCIEYELDSFIAERGYDYDY